jgi:hypothetical protein
MRWDGWVAIAIGAGLCGHGFAQEAQGPADAVVSGVMMLAGTGAFMAVRHGASFREPGAWFTSRPIALAESDLLPCSRRSLVAWMLGETAVMAVVTVGLSIVTRQWLTYADFGVWAIAIGAIKAGPAATAIRRHEADSGTTYRVARRPFRGPVDIVAT